MSSQREHGWATRRGLGEQLEGAWVNSLTSLGEQHELCHHRSKNRRARREWPDCPQLWFLPSQLGQAPCLCGYSHVPIPPRLCCKGVGMAEALPLVGQRLSAHWVIRTLKLMLPVADNMKDDVALLATVTLVGVLLQGGLAPVWEVGGSSTPAAYSLSFRLLG